MSKSLGNLVFVRDLVARVPGAAVRLLLASHHYRESWAYDDAEVDAAAARHRRYLAAMQGRRHPQSRGRASPRAAILRASRRRPRHARGARRARRHRAGALERQRRPLPAPRVSSCSVGCWASSARRPRPFRLERSAAPGGAIAASPETQHGGGDVLLEELVEELSLRHVDGGLDLLALAATSDPRGDAVGDHLGAHANVHQRVVVLATCTVTLRMRPVCSTIRQLRSQRALRAGS